MPLLKDIQLNLYRCGLTLPPQLHKPPSNLTQDKYNYGMCAQVIHTYVEGGGRHCLGMIFQCYTTSNAVSAVATDTPTWYSTIPL